MSQKKKPKEYQFSYELLIAHGKRCPYCKIPMMFPPGVKQEKVHPNHPNSPTRDHLIPISKKPGMGYIIVCRKCNWDKDNLTLPQWHKKLVEAQDTRAANVKEWMKKNLSFKVSS